MSKWTRYHKKWLKKQEAYRKKIHKKIYEKKRGLFAWIRKKYSDWKFKKRMKEYGKQWARHNGFNIR